MRQPIDRWAKLSLLLALGLAALGLFIQRDGLSPFWGGLLVAFGEAALVGGLADWFAVRALFVHPLGIPFPHSALIPRNRRRITREIRQLILTEWLPPDLLRSRLEAFDFVSTGLLPMVETLRPRLHELLRDLGRELLTRFDPPALAAPVARSLADALGSERMRAFLADMLHGARERHLFEPLLDDGIRRMQEWAGERMTWQLLRRHLERAAESYQERGLGRTLAFSIAELFGGVDLDGATTDLQLEMYRFLGDQLTGPSPMKQAVDDGLAGVERRLREDPRYFEELQSAVLRDEGAGRLIPPLDSVLTALRDEGLRELERDDSRLLAASVAFVDDWLTRFGDDLQARDKVNDWCRRLSVTLLERHHDLLGALVEEQMDRFTDKALTELIESRVGEDLNWIRLNGTFVGGLIGVLLYLLYALVR